MEGQRPYFHPDCNRRAGFITEIDSFRCYSLACNKSSAKLDIRTVSLKNFPTPKLLCYVLSLCRQ